ncbi:MAG: tRNA guanosine(34) transglycosylase Tgt [Candidatus Aminicenantes bacterium]|nr:tRNA guanosine(34) transglycosylase Tgt [Candidatus Aminicenantes bacterium]
MFFKILNTDGESSARTGLIKTQHGVIKTPVFMPVATTGTVKALIPELLLNSGAQIILGNTYHLFLRPGLKVIQQFKSLHHFMSWRRPILTDSGGFQIFSIRENAKVILEGVTFKSHIDGQKLFLSPEKVVDIQNILGSDIQMVLDFFNPHPSTRAKDKKALTITHNWAKRARQHFLKTNQSNAQFAIIQGGLFEGLRKSSLETLTTMDFEGYGIGGLSVGETQSEFLKILSFLLPMMPEEKPRYLMGSGTPEDIILAVEKGVDMFDCVLPSRNARNGTLFTSRGKLVIKNERYKYDIRPPDPDCLCHTCKNFSRAYLRHLYLSKEISSAILNTIHNLTFYLDFMFKIRYAINQFNFRIFKEKFLSLYKKGV